MSADTFWYFVGALLMLLKVFHYLSDGRAPLVEDLGGCFYFQNTLVFSPTCAVKIKGKVVKNVGILPFLKYFFDHKCVLKLKIDT